MIIRAGILTKKQESIRWQFFKVWLRGNIMGFGDMFLFFIFIILPFLVSIPAFNTLKKRGQLLFIDPFTHVFSAIFIVYMIDWFELSSYVGGGTLGNLAAEPLAAVVLAVIINYLKLLAPKRMSRWVLSFSSILVLLILTTIMWYFFPAMGN